MKLYRVMALVLAVLMMACVVVACDSEKEPEVTKTSIKVSFTIKDGAEGEIIEHDGEYEYSYNADETPTVTDILIDFCEMYELDLEFKDETNEVVTKIGNKTAGKGEYWTYSHNGTYDKKTPMYQEVVADDAKIVIFLGSLN